MALEDFREALSKKNVIIGSRETVKYLKDNKVKVVMVSNNCPENIKNNLERLTNMYKIKMETFNGTSKQFGVSLGKPFPIAAASIKSENK